MSLKFGKKRKRGKPKIPVYMGCLEGGKNVEDEKRLYWCRAKRG